MDQLNKVTKHTHFAPVMMFFILTIGFLVFVVNVVQQGAGSTVSKASRDTFLTPGDDALSLEKDLQNLSVDPVSTDENELNTVE